MKLTFDTNADLLMRSASFLSPIEQIEAKRGDGEHLELQLLRLGLPWEAPNISQFRFVVKPQGKWSADPHALADTWTWSSTLQGYEAPINYVTSALNQLLRIGDADHENGHIDLMAELAWRPTSAQSWRRSQTVPFRLHNNVWRGSESAPPGTPTEPDDDALYVLRTDALTAAVINEHASANTLLDTGLRIPLKAGHRRWFKFTLPYEAAATTTGSRWVLGLDGAVTVTSLTWRSQWNSNASGGEVVHNGTGFSLPTSASAGSYLAGNLATIEGFVVGAVDGSWLKARFASEVAGSRITLLPGAMAQWINLPVV
jgi:hypothetical protein